ncbi:Pyruvate carboxylase [hydrothermal vent metagenome]|uniref:pyruvate carboxylase n=1 Tax=hydrothermal vent metagenome TaxID=652676 RepID=A0A3B0TQ16_9ZZZZ
MSIKKILVANRSEIAIRVFRAANELGLKTVAVFANEDKLALHRFKADEAYMIGKGLGPVEAYLQIDEYIRIAHESGADAIHPGYGLLSESPEFADACEEAGIIFIGPRAETMRMLGNKVSARHLAVENDVPVVPATDPLPEDLDQCASMAAKIGYPLMLKASWGGGGRGMRRILSEKNLRGELDEAKREAKAAFGKDEMYLEKLVQRARHVEVQLLGDDHSNLVHLFERDCSVQRRNQKVVERAPAPYLSEKQRGQLTAAALRVGKAANYRCAGTVEFLLDADSNEFYFIEVNPRIQVEHTVTEEVTGIDIVKAQIHVMDGEVIGTAQSGIPAQKDIHLNGHALQCRVTTEDPEQNFIPDYGRITAYRGATGFGVRLDGGTAYSGAVITRFYDPLLEKVTCWAPSPQEAIARMDRALREFRIRGVSTNLAFLENIIDHPKFRDNSYTTQFIDNSPELFAIPKRRDRATKLLTYIADVSVNGHPDVKDRTRPPADAPQPVVPVFEPVSTIEGSRQILERDGPKGLASWMKGQKQILFTDTTMRDAHQSLLATRMRTNDIVKVASAYSNGMPNLFSLECWGGATFDVSMRFLNEDPWERLAMVRDGAPNILMQMLLRGSNAVGYTNYPDNVVQYFVAQAAKGGVDVFRVFDCLNWVENMRVAMDAVIEANKVCEGVICYTGDMQDPDRAKYDLKYYVSLAKELEKAGAHVLGLKDMAGLLKPAAAKKLIQTLKQEISLPIHFHTHDTSGAAAASVLAAVEAGVDAVDAAMDAFSGTTSQPCLGSLAAALRGTARDPGFDAKTIREISFYWEAVRTQYRAFESDLRSGASEVYLHEMPGGQFTNLKEQARSLGLQSRWHEVAQTYADVNLMFGDIVKVTPSSKVVGDMALAMVSSGLTRLDVEDPAREVAFPDSVIGFFAGDIGQPPGGFPKALQKKVLKGKKPLSKRPGAYLKARDIEAARADIAKELDQEINDFQLASYLMYPKVFVEFMKAQDTYGPTAVLPTAAYFYGLVDGDELMIDLSKGFTLVLRYLGRAQTNQKGMVRVFFELNGQPRSVFVPDRNIAGEIITRPKAVDGEPKQIGAPMPGVISTLMVKTGQQVKAGDVLLSIEAMKMETAIHAETDGMVAEVLVGLGDQIDAKDLLIKLE